MTSKSHEDLSVTLFFLSGIRGSNSRPSAWEADALPTELIPQRLVLPNRPFQGKSAETLRFLGDPHRIQTCNLLIRSQMLYSVELGDRFAGNHPAFLLLSLSLGFLGDG